MGLNQVGLSSWRPAVRLQGDQPGGDKKGFTRYMYIHLLTCNASRCIFSSAQGSSCSLLGGNRICSEAAHLEAGKPRLHEDMPVVSDRGSRLLAAHASRVCRISPCT